jgi:hypothetical protein
MSALAVSFICRALAGGFLNKNKVMFHELADFAIVQSPVSYRACHLTR